MCVCVLKLHAGSYWVTAHGKTQKGGGGGYRGVEKGTGVNKEQKLEKDKWNRGYEGKFKKSEIYQFYEKKNGASNRKPLSKLAHFPLTWDPSDDRTDYCTPWPDQKQT